MNPRVILITGASSGIGYEAARERGVKIIPVCSYAQRMMSGKDEYKDVL